MLSAIIFDFDGTLVDSIGQIWDEYRRVQEEMGLPQVTQRQFSRVIGLPWDTLLETLWPGIDRDRFSASYDRDVEEPAPFNGVSPLLERLSVQSSLGLMTSRGPGTLFPQMEGCGIDEGVFSAIMHRENTDYHKPDHRALIQMLGMLGCDPADAVYVGDSVIDARCAIGASVLFIGVLTGGAHPDDLADEGIEHIVDDVTCIEPLIQELG